MRTLLTGANGLIGANLVRELLAQGQQVRVYLRSSGPHPTLEGLPVEKVIGTLKDRKTLTRALEGCDGVYHLAGAYETGALAFARMYECFIKGTETVAEAMLDACVQRLVLCSSSITLPFGDKHHPAREDDPEPFGAAGPPYPGSLKAYYDLRIQQEALGRRYLERGLEVVIVNPDFVIGAYDSKPSSGAIVLQVARMPWLPVVPPGGKSFIHARACAEGHRLAFERGRPGERYLLGDHNLSYLEALREIAEVVGRPRPRRSLPVELMGVAGGVEKLVASWLPAGKDLSARLGSTFIGRYRSPEKARRELGLRSVPFRDAVEEAWAWFQAQGYTRPRTSSSPA